MIDHAELTLLSLAQGGAPLEDDDRRPHWYIAGAWNKNEAGLFMGGRTIDFGHDKPTRAQVEEAIAVLIDRCAASCGVDPANVVVVERKLAEVG